MPDGNEIILFDATKAIEAIRIKIRAEFVTLIPDEEWKKLIKKEVDAFMVDRWETPSYSNERKRIPSILSEMVREELNKEVKERLTAYFNTPEWTEKWGQDPATGVHGQQASEMIKRMLIDHTQEVMALMMMNAFQSAFTNIRNQMMNH